MRRPGRALRACLDAIANLFDAGCAESGVTCGMPCDRSAAAAAGVRRLHCWAPSATACAALSLGEPVRCSRMARHCESSVADMSKSAGTLACCFHIVCATCSSPLLPPAAEQDCCPATFADAAATPAAVAAASAPAAAGMSVSCAWGVGCFGALTAAISLDSCSRKLPQLRHVRQHARHGLLHS